MEFQASYKKSRSEKQMGYAMTNGSEQGWVWVKDNAGNHFVCQIEEYLKYCMSDATMGVNIGD